MKGLPRWLGWLGATAFAAAVAVGLLLDARAFAVNLSASVVAIVAGIWVATRLVDPILRARRRQDWLKVSDATLAAIRTHVVDVAVQVWVDTQAPGTQTLTSLQKGRDVLDGETLIGMDRLIVYVSSIAPDPETTMIHDDVKWDLSQITEVLTPRVMLTADDEELVGLLVGLEDAERHWMNLQIADQQAVIGGTVRGVIEVLKAARNLYAGLLERGGARSDAAPKIH
jgi:hypothetical protein